MPLIYIWALPYVWKFPGTWVFSAQSVLFTLLPTIALTSLSWPRKDRSDWPFLSRDVLGAFPTLACSMSAQSRAWPFSFDLPKHVPQTYGGLDHGKCLHHSRVKDVNRNICLPGLWKPVATPLTGSPHRSLLPTGTGALSGFPDSFLLFMFLSSAPTSNFLLKSYARKYNLMSFQIVPHLPLHPQRKWPSDIFLKQI